jgi:hypothetical protein
MVRHSHTEVKKSKFALVPPNVIPVVEKYNITDGWFRTMDDLPIVWVGTFEKELNPAFLEREYERIMMNFDRYKFEKLTMLYWKSFVESFLPSSNLPK